MGERVNYDKDKTLILLFNNGKRLWEDKTASIVALFEAYYYGNFTGYEVYFKGGTKKFFYKLENIQILKFVKYIDIEGHDVIIDNVSITATSVELYEQGIYKIINDSSSKITRKLTLKSNKYKKTLVYFKELAIYAEEIAKVDEPLYFISQYYKKMNPPDESVLFQYLQGNFKKTSNPINYIIIPFDFNQSQHKAIQNALDHSISIIEGPPGTGKTQTILNLISNIVMRDQTCAVVSNNNTAIDNVYEKLNEEGIGFLSASLGRVDKVTRFFENNTDDALDEFIKTYDVDKKPKIKRYLNELTHLMKEINEIELKNAQLKNELNAVLVEQKNQTFKPNPNIKINKKLSANKYLILLNRLEQQKKFGFIERWALNLQYKIKIQKLEINDVIATLEALFYTQRIKELKAEIHRNDVLLKQNNKEEVIRDLKEVSKRKLLEEIKKHYEKIERISFDDYTYKRDYGNFLKRYPVILSTSQSLINNAPKGFLFDYLIIDEASQGDLLTSAIAMSCAKKLVVVGDSRQLQQIDEERLFNESTKLAEKYDIPESYRYDANSILRSVKDSVIDVPTTLLREHYRSAPDIINFCNQMFYDGELIPMTSNHGTHIEIIKTVPGNHARKNPNGSGMYNQREIDELVKILNHDDMSQIGVITPFRYQANLIQERFVNTGLEADTIHKFQGRQKDEVYLSFVANSLEVKPDEIENRLYDFITDEKLLNVAISRGKNKVTLVLSDKIYHSKNNIIHDFIHYTEHLYGQGITKTSSITSVFDYLYHEHNELLKKRYLNKPKEHKTELLFSDLVEDTLKSYNKIGYTMHVRLSKIVSKIDMLNDEEKRYVSHPWTHVDFLFFNKVTKERLFVIEVDGIEFHEQNEKQLNHDAIKDRVLQENGVPIYRFKTNESNEKKRLQEILDCFTY